MNGLEKKQAAPDFKALGINLVTAGVVGGLVDHQARGLEKGLYAGVAMAGVVFFLIGKSWE